MRACPRCRFASRIRIHEFAESPNSHLEPVDPKVAHGGWVLRLIDAVERSTGNDSRLAAAFIFVLPARAGQTITTGTGTCATIAHTLQTIRIERARLTNFFFACTATIARLPRGRTGRVILTEGHIRARSHIARNVAGFARVCAARIATNAVDAIAAQAVCAHHARLPILAFAKAGSVTRYRGSRARHRRVRIVGPFDDIRARSHIPGHLARFACFGAARIATNAIGTKTTQTRCPRRARLSIFFFAVAISVTRLIRSRACQRGVRVIGTGRDIRTCSALAD